MKKTIFLLALAALIAGAFPALRHTGGIPAGDAAEAAARGKYLSIATGTMSGTYYSLGNSLASLFNDKGNGEYSFSAGASNGSGQNVEFLAAKESEFAFVNNDVAKIAYAGTGQYEKKKYDMLRGITSVYGNSIHIIVAADSPAASVKDLAGKKVSVGAAGSGVESITRLIVGAYGMNYWDKKDFAPEYLGVSESMEKLKNGQLDAVFMTGLPPMGAVVDVFMSNKMKLLPLEASIIDQLTTEYSELYKTAIPAGSYKDQGEAVDTVANSALILTVADMDEQLIYNLTKTIFENKDYLKERNNVWGQMTEENATKGMTVPLHPGAERYLKEVGVL